MKFLKITLITVIMLTAITPTITSATESQESNVIPQSQESDVEDKVRYQTHIQSHGWQEWVVDGNVSGTEGEAKRLEGIRISLENLSYSGSVNYQTHVQSYGWLPSVSDGAMSGTEGEAKRLEAIRIELSGEVANHYDIYYRVHAETYGWLDWAKNGEDSGTEGLGKRLEAIEVVLTPKGGAAPGKTNRLYVKSDPNISYTTHVEKQGWQTYVSNGQMSGTEGKGLRLEGIKINVTDPALRGGVQYRTHIQKQGWQNWKSNDELSGTSGKALRLEAIEMKLTGELSKYYDIYYRVHAQSYGWLGWAKNGETAGTEGLAKRLEGIEVVLVKKGEKAPGETTGTYVKKPSVTYSTHVQKQGWQVTVPDGKISGTSGKGLRLEGIKIDMAQTGLAGIIQYRTHVQKYGWQDWKNNGQMSGTEGEGLRLEAIQIRLTDELAKHFNVYYRVHAQKYGWMDWTMNGHPAGTEGFGYRLEAIEIRILPKGEPAPGTNISPYVINESTDYSSRSIGLQENFISYGTQYVEDPTLPIGETIITKHGEKGYDSVTYKVWYKSGKEFSRFEESRHKIAPVDEIVRKGTKVVATEVIVRAENDQVLLMPNESVQLYSQLLPSDINQQVEWIVANGNGHITSQGVYTASEYSGPVVIEARPIDGSQVIGKIELGIMQPITVSDYLGTEKDLTVPSMIHGKNASSYDYDEFKADEFLYAKIKGGVYPSMISSNTIGIVDTVGYKALYDKGLDTISLPETIKNLDANSLAKNNLSSIVLPESIEEIGFGAFGDNKLTTVVLPDSVISIGANVFSNNLLEHVSLPNHITEIPSSAFSNNRLSEFNFPESLKVIDGGAFQNNQFTKLSLPEQLEVIGSRAFYQNYIEELKLPESLITIGERAFEKNYIMELTIPDSVTVILSNAFNGNEIKNLKLGKSLERIESLAFYANNITQVEFPPSLKVINVMAFAFNNLVDVNIPEGVEVVGRQAFYYNTQLRNITLPTTLKVITERAFARTALTEITIPEGVEVIEPYAFDQNQLTKITIGSNVDIKANMLGDNNYFRDAYEQGGAGTYIGTQNGTWEKVSN